MISVFHGECARRMDDTLEQVVESWLSMGRAKRHYRTGGLYHVINRGHNQSFIFDHWQDKVSFLKIVRQVQEAHPFNIVYYVLMGNHYHFILEMLDVPLESIIQRINQTYGHYFNTKYGKSGTAFGIRCKVIGITDEPYFLQLIHYIANNPVRAGIVDHPDQYPWSAHRDVLRGEKRIVDCSRLFGLIGDSEKSGMDRYLDLLRNHNHKVSRAKNTEQFMIEQRVALLDLLLLKTVKDPFLAQQIRMGCRDKVAIEARNSFIAQAYASGFKTAEIAQMIPLSNSMIRLYSS